MCSVIYMYVYMGAYAYGGQGSTLLSSAISVHLIFFLRQDLSLDLLFVVWVGMIE